MMKRDQCLKVLARHRTNEVVVAVYQAAQEWLHISPSDLNYTFTGAMGQGSSHALGIALGRPDKRVVVLDGDGSLLMNLGTLVTIAYAAPKNLIHCLCQNGTYETNGAVDIPSRGTVSFVSDHRDSKGAHLAKMGSATNYSTLAVQASGHLAHSLSGAPRSPGRGASGES